MEAGRYVNNTCQKQTIRTQNKDYKNTRGWGKVLSNQLDLLLIDRSEEDENGRFAKGVGII